MIMRSVRAFESFGWFALGAVALALTGCGDGEAKPGTPTALAAFNQFAGGTGGGGGGGGGGSTFQAIAFNDKLIYGPGTAQFPELLNVFCELPTGAQQFVLMERARGSGGAFTPTTIPTTPGRGQFSLSNGEAWFLDMPTSDKEYQVDAQDTNGQSIASSNTIVTDINGSVSTFSVTVPNNSRWLDPVNGVATTVPTVPAPTTIQWSAVTGAAVYHVQNWSVVPSAFLAQQQGSIVDEIYALAVGGTSFNVQSGLYLEGPPSPAFASGEQYILTVIACNASGWGIATNQDIFTTTPGTEGFWLGGFIVQ